MENPLINQLTWFAIQLYKWTYDKVPPLIIDIDINTKSKEVHLLIRKPKLASIPWVILYVVNITVTLIGGPVNIFLVFDSRNRTTMRILSTSIVIFHVFILLYVVSSNLTLWRTSHCIRFINFVINNQLTYRKSS